MKAPEVSEYRGVSDCPLGTTARYTRSGIDFTPASVHVLWGKNRPYGCRRSSHLPYGCGSELLSATQ